jgi:hypothetical protein
MFKQRQQEALAIAEDRSGEQVIRATAMAEHYKRLKKLAQEANMTVITGRQHPPRKGPSVGGNPCGEIVLMDYANCLLQAPECEKEDDHVFTSYGQCRLCGAHRKPA